MALDLALVCSVPGVTGNQVYTVQTRSSETVGEMRARLPSELGLPPRYSIRMFNPTTGEEFADDAATVKSAGMLYVEAVFVKVVHAARRKRRRVTAREELLMAEIERLRGENAQLRMELTKLGKDFPEGASLLASDTAAAAGAMDEEEEEEEEAKMGAGFSVGGAGGGSGGGAFAIDLGGGGATVGMGGG
eukprot:CAMPEP_0196779458 /NCGR_PEP_ID=MMETSP1104-20130614/6398_1 /TAXON_ID=33652 /ORGANISM="Cafeteria sp., Strain Caron Lab Isolate" /LENGTH=189 /DNA_ID=CAMNT_0042149639 /DNA_START=8 /DNA_END=573 /DNA_ORIENTATION=-